MLGSLSAIGRRSVGHLAALFLLFGAPSLSAQDVCSLVVNPPDAQHNINFTLTHFPDCRNACGSCFTRIYIDEDLVRDTAGAGGGSYYVGCLPAGLHTFTADVQVAEESSVCPSCRQTKTIAVDVERSDGFVTDFQVDRGFATITVAPEFVPEAAYGVYKIEVGSTTPVATGLLRQSLSVPVPGEGVYLLSYTDVCTGATQEMVAVSPFGGSGSGSGWCETLLNPDKEAFAGSSEPPMTSEWNEAQGTLRIFRNLQPVVVYQRDTVTGLRSIGNAITEMYAVGRPNDNLVADFSPIVPPQVYVGVQPGQCTNDATNSSCDYFVHHAPVVTILQSSGSAVRFRVTATASQHNDLGMVLPGYASEMIVTVPFDPLHTVIKYDVHTQLSSTGEPLAVRHALRPLPFFELVRNADPSPSAPYQQLTYLHQNCLETTSILIPLIGPPVTFLFQDPVCTDRPWVAVYHAATGNLGLILQSWNWSTGRPQLLSYTEPVPHPGRPNLYFQSSDASRNYDSGDWRGNVTFLAYTSASDALPVQQFRDLLPGAFTDDPLMVGTVIRRVHVTQLRDRVNAVRGKYGLQPYPWTDPSLIVGSTIVRAQHIRDLRDALTQVYVAAGVAPPDYTDPDLVVGLVIKVAHITELRAAILRME